MAIYFDDPEMIELRMLERVVGLFDRRPHMQRIIRFGLAGMNYSDELDDSGEEGLDVDCGQKSYLSLPIVSDNRDRRLSRTHAKSLCLPPLNPSDDDHPRLRFLESESEDSDYEAKEKLNQSKKRIGKAEKKRLKKQKQKERKRLEKLKKENPNPSNLEEKGDDSQPSESGGNKPVEGAGEGSASVKELVPSRDTDSSDFSEDESNGGECKDESEESEELDLTSTFVNKAAVIAKRKLEQQQQKVEKKEKKVPVKAADRPVESQTSEDKDNEKKVCATVTGRTLEDNVKISTDLAVIGNKFASTGEYRMAVKYFTDAIKYNPTEYKLFGNRSFCFEKMQEYEKALTDAELCLSMFPGWVKGLYRKGRALTGLKRYEEAAETFTEVLKLDTSCAEAAQELMRVQIIQLMEFGFSREQSSNALIIHGTVKKALEVLSTLNNHPGVAQNSSLPPVQVANINGVSPVLSANANSPSHCRNEPLASVHNTSAVPKQSEAIRKANEAENQRPLELFPVWVGNIVSTVTESMLMDLFSKAGIVRSVKLLLAKRCAFVNYTKQEDCDDAIKRLHGFELNGIKLVVRYPDRIPAGMGISKSALKAEDLQNENMRQTEYFNRSNGGYWRPRPIRSYRHVSDQRNVNQP